MTIGTQLGPYAILAPLGAGGMGEVYRAKDTRLDRTVAIKILTPHGLGNPKQVQRFEREARAVSKLNHPHICALYDIGQQDGVQFIVMEHLDGETLARRLTRGALSLDQLLRYAIEIADALAHAHRQGVVHRDLKPANIMLTAAGAKLLDFGIAALLAPEAMASDSHATVSGAGAETLTEEGTFVGTLQYIAPEQLEARPTDARADIFAFGAIVYEMATGQQAFKGTSRASVIAAVLEHDPELLSATRLKSDAARPESSGGGPAMPWMLDQIVARCLAKDPGDRFQTAVDLRQALRWMAESGAQAGAPAPGPQARGWRHYRVASIAVGAVVIVAVLAAAMTFRRWSSPEPSDAAPIRFEINPPSNAAFSPSSASLALSPDGRSLAFTASAGQGDLALWIQSLDSLEARRVPGTGAPGQLFWSPDSRSVAFADTSASWKLKTIDIAGGLPQSVGDARLPGVGTWSRDQAIILKGDGALEQIPIAGGPPIAVTTLDSTHGETEHNFPGFLPDGRHFLFLASSAQPEHDGVAYLASLGSSDRVRLFSSDSQVVYAAPGYLLYMLGNTLLARPFDTVSLRVTGEPIPIADQVERTTGSRRGAFTVSQTGVLAYRRLNETQLVWFDRGGRRLGTVGPPGHYRNPALSPDGRRLAVGGLDSKTGTWDVWTMELDRGVASRFTLAPSHEDMPVWSPDGGHLAFMSDRDEGISFYQKAATGGGAEEVLLRGLRSFSILNAWRPDGLVYATAGAAHDVDLWRLPLSGDRTPVPLLQTQFADKFCEPSPDGRWMAYVSGESGKFEVYAAAFPSGQGKWPISVGGGTEPAWRRDGKELFYLAPDRHLMAVSIKTGASVEAGPPERLFQAAVSSLLGSPYTRNQYVVTADGQRFLINEPAGKASLSAMTVVVGWTAALRK